MSAHHAARLESSSRTLSQSLSLEAAAMYRSQEEGEEEVCLTVTSGLIGQHRSVHVVTS